MTLSESKIVTYAGIVGLVATSVGAMTQWATLGNAGHIIIIVCGIVSGLATALGKALGAA